MARSPAARACAEFPIELIEHTEGSLADLAAFLRQHGLVVSYVGTRPGEERRQHRRRLRLIELSANRTASWLADQVKTGRADGPTIAIVHSSSGNDLSKALAAGCDDAWVAPLDPSDLLHRLDAAATLARLQGELAQRHRALAEFGAAPPRDYLRPALPKPNTLVVGPASQAQVRIIEMLGDTPTAFTDTADQAGRLMLAEPFDLVIFSATDRPSLDDAMRWSLQETDGPTSLLFTTADDVEGPGTSNRFDDRIAMDQAIESMCIRLQFWRSIAGHRRALRQGPANTLADMTIDGLTGLANHGFLFAYADQCRHEPASPRAILLARLANLRDINRQHGFPQGNQALRRMGRELRRNLRASDFLSHLGGGQFGVIFTGVGREELSAIMQRMNETLAEATAANGDWRLRAQLRACLVDGDEPLPEALERMMAGSTRMSETA